MYNSETDRKEALATAAITNYISPYISAIKNVSITEWDIHSAGLSVLKFKKLLPEDLLNELSTMEKSKRTVKEGLLQRQNPKLAEEIVKTLSQARQAFVLVNSIKSEDILSIKKDALFLINQNPKTNVIKDAFEFRKKNTYTSYILLGDKKELYHNSSTNILDIKGFPKEYIEAQEKFLWKDVRNLLKSWEKNSDSSTMFEILKSYRSKYLNKQLPLETYREIETGCFRCGEFLFNSISENEVEDLDISQNYMNVIFPLIQRLL